MSNEIIFRICDLAVIPGWLLLLLAPKWKWTIRLAMYTIPVLLAIAYLWVFIANFETLHANFVSYGAVEYFFHLPGVVLAAWIHYLAFDLFVGAWMVQDARRRRILHLAVIPCLILTFVLGPAGLLFYFMLRTGLRGSTDAKE
jgi:ABA4-like protein